LWYIRRQPRFGVFEVLNMGGEGKEPAFEGADTVVCEDTTYLSTLAAEFRETV
jgi:hypothetical protein